MRLILILHLLCSSFVIGQEIRFFREDITFQIAHESFFVDGYYWFSNPSNTNVEKLIFFPFATSDKNEIVDSVELFNITKGAVQNILNRNNTGFYFVLNMMQGDTVIMRIQYRQKIVSDSVLYVLRSTQYWQRPIESAEYKLRIGKLMNITKISIIPDKVYTIEDENIYYWKRNNFMPQTDFIFHFKPL
jgi:hypothetical protein